MSYNDYDEYDTGFKMYDDDEDELATDEQPIDDYEEEDPDSRYT